ncbi:unnamed protein product, partial [Closterium sp. NIES-54]
AMLTLGEMLTHGVGMKANPTEAMAWLNKAYARGLSLSLTLSPSLLIQPSVIPLTPNRPC